MGSSSWRRRLADTLIRWGSALQPPRPLPPPPLAPLEPDQQQQAASTKLPGVRPPLSVEPAARRRDLTVLKREACDALAALGAAHAVVTSARLAQLQSLRSSMESGEATEDDLADLGSDYQAWQNDQVRLFDALALVMGMAVPEGRTFDLIDGDMAVAARAHLEALAAEYQRRLLTEQFEAGEKEG